MEDSLLADVKEAHRFILSGGRIINNLEELSTVLPSITDEEFESHVSKKKNDFKNWIESCIHDNVLVKAIDGKTSRDAIQNLIMKRVAELKSGSAATQGPKKVMHMIRKLKKHALSKKKVLQKEVPKKEFPLKTDEDVPYVQIRQDCMYHTDLKHSAKEFLQGVLMGFFVGVIIASLF